MKINLNLTLGIAAGLINCIVWYVVARSLNFYNINIEVYRYYVTLFSLLLGVFLSVYFSRKNNNGFIEFKDAAKSGIVYTLLLAACLGIFNYIYYTYLSPDVVEYFVSEARKEMLEKKMADADITKTIDVIKTYYGSFRMFMSTIIMGVIISLIMGAILRRKNPALPFSANE